MTTGQTDRDTHFMELALRQAEAALSAGQTPFGAVVVDAEGYFRRPWPKNPPFGRACAW